MRSRPEQALSPDVHTASGAGGEYSQACVSLGLMELVPHLFCSSTHVLDCVPPGWHSEKSEQFQLGRQPPPPPPPLLVTVTGGEGGSFTVKFAVLNTVWLAAGGYEAHSVYGPKGMSEGIVTVAVK